MTYRELRRYDSFRRSFTLAAALALEGMTAACSGSEPRAARVSDASEGVLEIDSLLSAGDSIYRKAPDSAGTFWTRAHQLSESLPDSARIARALTGLGQVAYQRGAYDTARVLGEQALALKRRLGMNGELFRSLNSLGLIAWRQERLSEAASLLRQATGEARAMGDSLGVAKAMLNTGLVLQDYVQFDSARATLSAARDRLLVEGDSVNYARALNNLAALDLAVGDPQAALVQLAAARRLNVATSDLTGEVNARGQVALAYSALGDGRRAFSMIDSALTLARRLRDRTQVADNLRITADLYLVAGDPQHALDYYRQSAALTDSLGLPEEHATLRRNEARALYAAGNMAQAYRSANDALVEHERGGFFYPAMRDRLLLAELAQQMSKPKDAQDHLQSARKTAARIGVPIATAEVALGAAKVADMGAQWREVIKELDASAASIALMGSDAVAAQLSLRARAQARLGNTTQAIADGRAAVAAIEELRNRYDSGELRTTYVSSKSSAYADLALVLLEAKRDSEAFAVADAARGRAILEHLSNARSSLQRDAGTARLADVDALLRRIDALTAKLRASEQGPPRDRSPEIVATTQGLRDSLRQARSEYEALRARRADPSSAAAQMIQPPPASVRLAQASLLPGELLVEYFVTDARLLIFVVSSKEYRLIDHPIRADPLAAMVGLARSLIGRRESEDGARKVLVNLHSALIAPVIASGMLRDARTLVIVPHGLLSYLPFAALVSPTSNRYLVEDVAVLVAPSAAVLSTLRIGDAARKRRAIARPAPSVYALAPFTRTLPGSLAELVGMRQSVPALKELVDGAASERALRRMLQDNAVVHVASHAVMNPGNPLFSRVELAPGDKGSENDGWLHVHEILGIDVRSPLIFLSGCETALGGATTTHFEEREDFTSIAQAWLVAGADNVVATLWRIDDAAAAEFTSRFYNALENSAVPEALAIAQRSMIKDAKLQRPYLWAAYQAVGDGRATLSGSVGAAPQIRSAKPAKVSVSR